jgi:hypothetical protein
LGALARIALLAKLAVALFDQRIIRGPVPC